MHSANATTSVQSKIMLMRSRFRSTKDLWLMMTERRK